MELENRRRNAQVKKTELRMRAERILEESMKKRKEKEKELLILREKKKKVKKEKKRNSR